jgi:effector-binding domain-containing protein
MSSTTPSEFFVEIKSVATRRVVALRGVIPNYNSQMPLWSRVLTFVEAHNIPRTGACFAIFYDRGYKESDVDNEVCLPIAMDTAVPDETDGVRVYVLPEMPRAASVVHTGPYSDLRGVYEQLFAWIAANGETCSGPNHEIYHVGVEAIDGDESKLVTELLVPLAEQ